MTQSMTGFGRSEALIGEMTIRVEIKSVNNKQLKSTLRMPSWLNYLETTLESELKKSFKRGSFFAQLSAERNNEEGQIVVNHEKLEALMRAFSARGLNQQPLCLVPGVIEENQRPTLTEQDELEVVNVFRSALTDLKDSRLTEGAALRTVLLATLKSLDEERQSIFESYADHKDTMESKLKARLAELEEREGGLQSLDPLLMSRELALHVDRVDIREELDRLSMHIAEAAKILDTTEGPCGRKLEFMAQEMGREVNTTGSKSQSYQISKSVVEMKTFLEQFREQIANVE